MNNIFRVVNIAFVLTLTFFTLSGNISFQPKTGVVVQSEDRQIFDEYIDFIEPWNSESTEVILEKTAMFFIGSQYAGQTLDQSHSEMLTVNLREFDCFTFVETVIALSLTASIGGTNFDTFSDILHSIRYRDNETLGYQSRLHYTTDWIYENEKNGILKNISGGIGGIKDDKIINFMSTHRSSYKQLESDDVMLNEIIKVENHINEREGFYYIPKEKIAKTDPLVPNLSVIGFTTNIEGLDVTHVGFAFRKDGELKFIHASSALNEVVIEEQSLSDYCNGRKSCTGIITAKML